MTLFFSRKTMDHSDFTIRNFKGIPFEDSYELIDSIRNQFCLPSIGGMITVNQETVDLVLYKVATSFVGGQRDNAHDLIAVLEKNKGMLLDLHFDLGAGYIDAPECHRYIDNIESNYFKL
jgi:hypothetical protein